ncbi:MAG: hypothetical protein FWB91_05810 [Defluviitaleaceae bacterium]|nr:hypothetical protein [Defluviitaleaceae bacterium]
MDEKKRILITGKMVLKFIGVLSGILGVVLLITNLTGITAINWLIVGATFVAPVVTFVAIMND